MKRLLALAATLALVLPVTAHATGPAQRWVWQTLPWKTAAPVGTTASGFTAVDSMTTSNGSTTAQTTYDTTAAFPLTSAELPEYPRVSDTAIDTVVFLAFAFVPANTATITAGFDSLLVQGQVSQDGVTWSDVTPTFAFDATRTTGNANGTILVEPSANANSVIKWYKQTILAVGSPSGFITAVAPTDITLWGWRYIRFIVGDCGYTGIFRGEVGYFTSAGLSGLMNQ